MISTNKLKSIIENLQNVFRRKLHPTNLTPQEEVVFGYIMKGFTYKEIGEQMHITRKTVSKHASNIFKKTNCNSRKNLEKKYRRKHLLNRKLNRRRKDVD